METYVYQDKVSPTEKKLKNFDYNWEGKSVLELGCNVGKLGVYVLEKGAKKYTGVDIDKEMIAIGKERYDLDLHALDVSRWEDYNYDTTIAMALFHHLKKRKLGNLLAKISTKELIFEVPVGLNDVGLYQNRTEEDYREMIKEHYGETVRVVDSGATNDPYNKRVIFHCKENVPTS